MDGETDWSEQCVRWNDISSNWVNDKLRKVSDVLHAFKGTCLSCLPSINMIQKYMFLQIITHYKKDVTATVMKCY